MDSDLLALLKESAVKDEVVKSLSAIGCTQMHLFAHWLDDNAEISTFLETRDAAKGNPAQRAAMRFSYAKSKELTTRALKRSAQGLGDESIDEPLPPEHQRDLLARANTLYRWGVIDSRQICCDMQLAKIRREFQNFQPSMLQVGKVRTLAQSQRQAAPKRQKINESLSISIGSGGDEVFQRMDVVTWPESFAILTRTWTVCGSFEVAKDATSADRVLMVEMHQAETYRFEFVSRIRDYRERYSDASITKALSIVEESFRSKAVELTRSGDKVPWGVALVRVLTESMHLWNILRDHLILKSDDGHFGRDRRQSGDNAQRGNRGVKLEHPRRDDRQSGDIGVATAKSGKGSSKGRNPAADRIMFTSAAKGQTPYCRAHNDKGSCHDKSCRFIHVCNAQMSDGSACGSKSHGRAGHDEAKHGAAKAR